MQQNLKNIEIIEFKRIKIFAKLQKNKSCHCFSGKDLPLKQSSFFIQINKFCY